MADPHALDRGTLADVGLGGLSETDQASLLEAVTAELQFRVGTRLAEAMSSQQVDEFEALMSTGDDAAASEFLERVVPWRGEAGLEEIEVLRTLLETRAAQILEAVGGRE
jgi:hypothetical protein